MEATRLISRCKAGERQALDLLYQQYKPKLLNICKQYTKDDDAAEDLLHDAFVVIFTSLDRLENTDKLEAWMFSIVRNVCYHYQRHMEMEQAALQEMSQEKEYVEEATSMPDYDQLQTLVSQLPQGYQQIFRLSVFEGLSHQEISQMLGIAPHSSSSQLSHAKRMLQALIRQSWILILLLIAIPTVVWKLMQKEESGNGEDSHSMVVTSPDPSCRRGNTAEIPTEKQKKMATNKIVTHVLTPQEEIVTHALTPQEETVTHVLTPQGETATHALTPQEEIVTQVLPLQGEIEEVTDSVPYHIIMEQIDTLTETAQETPQEKASQRDTLIYQQLLPLPSKEESHYITDTKTKPSTSWDIKMAYNGQIGQRDDYLAATTIGKGSFDANSNSPIPAEHAYDNWIGYNDYLTNSPYVVDDAETRSLMNIAAQNSAINGGMMEAQYEHKLPVTIQLMFTYHFSPLTSRPSPLTSHLYLETGLSYTKLSSTINTGSSEAYIQERQRLHYLGVPLRLGWQWYSKAHLSLYSSAGLMLEVPIRGITDINHISNGVSTYHSETSLSVPWQFSTTLGLGLQYDFTTHLGLYIEPSLQYFFNNGSDLKTYRTEHPFSVTLPLGIRFHW